MKFVPRTKFLWGLSRVFVNQEQTKLNECFLGARIYRPVESLYCEGSFLLLAKDDGLSLIGYLGIGCGGGGIALDFRIVTFTCFIFG